VGPILLKNAIDSISAEAEDMVAPMHIAFFDTDGSPSE
jgi:hypothetical protein